MWFKFVSTVAIFGALTELGVSQERGTNKYGCVETPLSLKKTYYQWKNNVDGKHSLWVSEENEGDGEGFVIWYNNQIAVSGYRGFGIYSCASSSIYKETVTQTRTYRPGSVEECNAAPIIWCADYQDADAQALYEAAPDNPRPGNYTHFHECKYWYNYDDGARLPTQQNGFGITLNRECTFSSVPRPGRGTGQTTDTQTDTEGQVGIDATTSAVLWSVLSVFMVIALGAAAFFGYRYHQKKQALAADPEHAHALKSAGALPGTENHSSADNELLANQTTEEAEPELETGNATTNP